MNNIVNRYEIQTRCEKLINKKKKEPKTNKNQREQTNTNKDEKNGLWNHVWAKVLWSGEQFLVHMSHSHDTQGTCNGWISVYVVVGSL